MMIPKEYDFFCKLKKVVACNYFNSVDCPRTCNLKSQLEGDIESEMDDVLGITYNKYLNFDN